MAFDDDLDCTERFRRGREYHFAAAAGADRPDRSQILTDWISQSFHLYTQFIIETKRSQYRLRTGEFVAL